MKRKKNLILTIILLSIGLFLLESKAFASDFTEVSVDDYTNNVKDLPKLTAASLIRKIEKEEDFYLYIGKNNCIYCRALSPQIKLANELVGKTLYYYDLNSEELTESIQKMITETFQISGVPAILSIKSGQVFNRLIGADTTAETIEEMLLSPLPEVTSEEYVENLSQLSTINGNELSILINNESSFILYIGDSYNYYSKIFSRTIKDLSLITNTTIYHFDISGEELDEPLIFLLQNNLQITGLPTVLKIDHGKLSQQLSGSETTIEDLLTLIEEKTSSSGDSQIESGTTTSSSQNSNSEQITQTSTNKTPATNTETHIPIENTALKEDTVTTNSSRKKKLPQTGSKNNYFLILLGIGVLTTCILGVINQFRVSYERK